MDDKKSYTPIEASIIAKAYKKFWDEKRKADPVYAKGILKKETKLRAILDDIPKNVRAKLENLGPCVFTGISH